MSYDMNFYYLLGKKLYINGNTVFNEITVAMLLDNFPDVKKEWEEKGGYSTIRGLMAISTKENIDVYISDFNKYRYALSLHKDGFDIGKIMDKVKNMNSDQLYSYFDFKLNNSNFKTASDLNFESLDMSDDEFQSILDGENVGIQYWKGGSKLLNSMTMGLPKGDITSVGAYINAGKSSFVFSNIIIGALESDENTKCLVVSNEMKSTVYKQLLIIYVLTKKLKYWKISRKKLKSGNLNEEEISKVNEAREYIKKNYSNRLVFLKIFDYSTDTVEKAIKKYSAIGFELMIYDVMKTSDATDAIWQKLIEDSKSLFQTANKYNVAVVVTQQLAMSTKGRVSKLDISCLANGKQSAEVMSEMIMFRQLSAAEKDVEDKKRYCKPYELIFENGKCVGKKDIVLKPDGNYYAFFLCKSRNDGMERTLLYEYNGAFNIWEEMGYCTISESNYY